MWRKVAVAALIGGSTWLSSGEALWSTSPVYAQDADAIQRAKDEFDEGSRRYREEKWELAASHFETADELAPTARALRMAIRARSKAGQKARAATLAAQAKSRYPDDENTNELADATLDEAKSSLHELKLSCETTCIVAVGKRAVPGQRRKTWTVYLEPGKQRISVSFKNGSDMSKKVEAEAGGSTELELDTPPAPNKPDPTPAPDPDPGDWPDPEPDPEQPANPEEGGGISPAWFAVSMVITAGLGGTLVWSGIDTISSPGTETVERECVGQGTDCEEYQSGVAKQTRTNALIGATAGMGLVTVLLAVFTDWGDGEQEEGADSAHLTVAPSLGWRSGEAGVILGGTF